MDFSWLSLRLSTCQTLNSEFSRCFTGEMVFPIVNAINEGLVLLISVSVIFGIVGNEHWAAESPVFGLQYRSLFVITTAGFTVISSFIKWNNKSCEDGENRSNHWHRKELHFDNFPRNRVPADNFIFSDFSHQGASEIHSVLFLNLVFQNGCPLKRKASWWHMSQTPKSNHSFFFRPLLPRWWWSF